MRKTTGLFIAAIASTVFFNCASVHTGSFARDVDKAPSSSSDNRTTSGLVISSAINDQYCSEYFGMVDFTFENTTQDWIRIKKIIVDFGTNKIDTNTKFTSGYDLKVYIHACDRRNAIKQFNNELLLGSVAGVAYGTAMLSDNEDVKTAGMVVLTGLAASLTVADFNRNLDSIRRSAIFPENHLLSEGFIIPPNLFVNKWLLINSKNHHETGFIGGFYLEYEMENGQKERVYVNLRSIKSTKVGSVNSTDFKYTSISDWQKKFLKTSEFQKTMASKQK